MRICSLTLLLAACAANTGPSTNMATPAEPVPLLQLGPRLDFQLARGPCMDAELADIDEDGALDVVLAMEGAQNVVLTNDGTGRFEAEVLPTVPGLPPPFAGGDSEDVAVIDVDGDGDLDLLFVAEDLGGIDELYLREGGAWLPFPEGLPAVSITNGLDAADLDGDGLPEVVLANRGPNALWSADGSGGFVDVTEDWLPEVDDASQDAELVDMNGDGQLDLLFANEQGDNRLLLRQGDAFVEAPFPAAALEETREVDAGDLDGDGDIDVVLANVGWGQGPSQDRLLLADGDGFVEADLPRDPYETLDIDLVDIDGDGDLDMIRANAQVLANRLVQAPYEVWLNDGGAGFSPAPESLVPFVEGEGLDVEVGDLDGDGLPDIYLCGLGTRDAVLLSGR